ncbi:MULTISPECIES: hypothetical protein [Empedobacter]|uniref:hypothetical protein n=2 Tax=Weeksellaceae TaxID=2762318 RepID=UPI00056EC7B9|nr:MULTISPECIES: hypothetical protein [Empedobacter]MBW1618213.1 hypothetical protein [Empedobacter falsenii]MDM1138466.1 hypothetical protein [Empedobacter sp. R132-2]
MKYFLLSFILFFCSCSSTFNSTYKSKQLKKTVDTFIELGEKHNERINPNNSYLILGFDKLKSPDRKVFFNNAEFGVGITFMAYLGSCNTNEKTQQYEYKNYTIAIIDSADINFKRYKFLKPINSKKLNLNENTFQCKHGTSNPLYYSFYFDKKGIIQSIDPWGKRKLIRDKLIEKGFNINLNSDEVYSKGAVDLEE